MSTQSVEVLPDNPTFEMSASAEFTTHSGEVLPLTPGEQKLLEAITFPPLLQEKWHMQFDRVIQEQIDSCIDPKDRELITVVAGAIEWEWFGNPDDPLPACTILSDHKSLQFTEKAVEQYSMSIREYLYRALSEISVARDFYYVENMREDIITALAEIIQETPAYAFLRALASEAPQLRDIPLTLAQRMIREAQEEDAVRKTFGLNRQHNLRLHYDAHNSLQRRLYQLDDEKVQTKEQKDDNPKQLLLQYILNELNSFLGREGDERVVSLTKTERDELTGLSVRGKEDYLTDSIFTLSDEWISASAMNGRRYLEDFDYSWSLLYALAKGLIDQNQTQLSALEILNKAIVPPDDFDIFREGAIRAGLKAYLFRMDTPIAKERYGISKTWRPNIADRHNYIDVVSAGVIEEMRQQPPFGKIVGSARKDTTGRVITGARRMQADLPVHINDYACMLYMDENADYHLYGALGRMDSLELDMDELEPLIPGYYAAAYDENERVWYFKRAEFDPYRGSAELKIDEQSQAALAAQLQAIGMDTLASEIAHKTNLDLSQLVALIREYSDYTFDKKYALSTSFLKERTDEGFKQLISESGRLQVQCTGAATFLCHVLKTALPSSRVASLSGHVVDDGGDISSIGHVQVMVSHEGRQYIVDATPPSILAGTGFDGGNRGMLRRREYDNLDQKNPFGEKVPMLQQGDVKTELQIIGTAAEIAHAEKTAQVQNVTERTKQLLRAHFSMPAASDEQLYREVVKLKKDADPVRRVLELVLQAEAGVAEGRRNIEKTQAYLEAVKGANGALLRRLGVPRYDDALLRSLASILEDLDIKAQSKSLQE